MSGAASQVHATMLALKAQLEARAGLAGVTVATGGLGRDTPPKAIIMWGVAPWDVNWASAGGSRTRDETFELALTVWTTYPAGGEGGIQGARSAAFAIYDEVAKQIWADPAINTTLINVVRFTNMVLDQGASTSGDGQWARIDFSILCKARI